MKENGQTEGTLFSMDKELMKVMIDKINENTGAVKAGNADISGLVQAVDGMKGVDARIAAVEAEMGLLRDKIGELVEKPEMPLELVRQLREDLKKHTEFFEKPSRKEIHYRHFLGWPIAIVFLMGFLSLGLWASVVSANQRADRYSASDIKYRRVKLIVDSVLHKKLEETDS